MPDYVIRQRDRGQAEDKTFGLEDLTSLLSSRFNAAVIAFPKVKFSIEKSSRTEAEAELQKY